METPIEVLSERERILSEHVEGIRAAQAALIEKGQLVGNGLLAGANHRRILGIKLASLKAAEYIVDGKSLKVVPHGGWEKLFCDHGDKGETAFAFTAKTANNYILFSVKHPDEITDLKEISRSGHDLLIDAGEIAEEGREKRQSPQPEGQAWLSGLLKAWEGLASRFEKKPLDGWTETDRTTLKEKLRPMVELYAKL